MTHFIKDLNGNSGRTFSTAYDLYTFCGFSLQGIVLLNAAKMLKWEYEDDDIDTLETACEIMNDIDRAANGGDAPLYKWAVV